MGINDITPEELDKMSRTTEWGESIEDLLKATYVPKNKKLASSEQIGGTHYKEFEIQPAYFCYVNKIPYLEATAIKYLCRWRKKGGVEDLDKAKHFIDLLKEYYEPNIG